MHSNWWQHLRIYLILDSQPSGLFEDLSAGNYNITVQDGNTCSETTSISIEEESFLSVETKSQDVSCYNEGDV